MGKNITQAESLNGQARIKSGDMFTILWQAHAKIWRVRVEVEVELELNMCW